MLERILRLSLTKVLLIAAAWILCVLAHNFVYALSGRWLERPIEEPVFFLLAVLVLPAYVIVALLYTGFGWVHASLKRARQD
jgi:uncharacterized BrkB/YihY/UPF0761 family membrane protein